MNVFSVLEIEGSVVFVLALENVVCYLIADLATLIKLERVSSPLPLQSARACVCETVCVCVC